MARRRQKKTKKSVEKICGSVYATLVSASTAGTRPLQPSVAGWGRLNTFAELFNLYRFTKLQISWLAPNTNVTDACVGVATGTIDGVPTTNVEVSQLEYAGINWGDQTTPTHLVIPSSYLLGQSPNKWWKCQTGTPDDWEEIQGQIFGTITVSGGLNIWVDYEVEFCDFVAPAQSPMYKLVEGTEDLYRRTGDVSAGRKAATASLLIGKVPPALSKL